MNHFEYSEDFMKKLKLINKRAFVNTATSQASVFAVNFSKDRFIYKNWIDKNREAWNPRQRKNRGSLMAVSGRLKRSIREVYRGNGYVIIGTDVPYAQIHNEGGKISKTVTVKAHTRTRATRAKSKSTGHVKSHKRQMSINMPARQFMGESAFLLKTIHRNTKQLLEKTLKK